MTDKFSKEVRSKIMKSIRSKSKLEDMVAKEIWRRGIRFRRNVNKLYGKPDISIIKYKVVIFIDSCFWHGCKIHGHIPKSNTNYWIKKINKNIDRDKKVNNYYKEKGWNILRIWEHQIRNDFEDSIEQIVMFIKNAKNADSQLNRH